MKNPNMDNPDIETMQAVSEAAREGARFIAPGHPDIIEEVASAITVQWNVRKAKGNLPINPKGWAFICAKHYAGRIIAEGKRFITLSDAIAESVSDSSEATLIEAIQPPPIGWLKAGEAIEALQVLITITTRIIEQKADEIDQRILDLHYRKHWTFSRIAIEIGITDAAARKRWSRLMFEATDEIVEVVRNNKRLAAIFAAILEDQDDFRSTLLNLISIVSSKGFAAIETAIDSIFPA